MRETAAVGGGAPTAVEEDSLCSRGPQALSDFKPGVTARRDGVIDLDLADPRARRAVSHVAFEAFHRLSLAFGHNLDTAIGQIADNAMKPFTSCRRLGKQPEADALNAAPDEVASRDAHAKETEREIIPERDTIRRFVR